MSLTQSMLQSADVSRFGWTLVHSLWQGGAIAGLLTLTLFALRRRSAQSRYLAGCIAMMLMLGAPVGTYLVIKPALQPASLASLSARAPAPSIVALDAVKPVGSAHVADITVRSSAAEVDRQLHPDESAEETAPVAPIARQTPRARAQQIFPWVVSIWAVGVLAMSLWNLGGWFTLQRLRSVGAKPASREVEQQLAGLRKRLGLQHVVTIVESVRVRSPLVIGAFKPVILFPACVLCELPAAQLESILAHELAHICRHDYLINLIQSVIETLLFYHPATWWISRVIRTERENCCDDIAIAVCNDRATYASALAGIAAAQASTLAVAANGGILINRVRRILGLPQLRQRGSAGWAVGIVGVAACLTFTLTIATPIRIRAQSPSTQPASNEASIDLLVIDVDSKKPLPDAEISWRHANRLERLRTGPSGHARIVYDKDAADMPSFDLTAKHAGYVSTGVHLHTPKADPIPASFILPMPRGVQIGGHVVNEQKQSVAHATVNLQISNSAEAGPRVPYTMSIYDSSIQTDDDGNWSFDAAPKDLEAVFIRLTHKDYESDASNLDARKPAVAELLNGSSVLVMTKGLQVAGRVEDESGKPISGAHLSLGSAGFDPRPLVTTSLADGSFSLPHCSPNPQTVLVAMAARFAPTDTRFSLSASKSGLSVRMMPAKTFKFLVVDHARKPVPGAYIQTRAWHGLDILMHWSSPTDAEGRCVWADAPGDSVTFSIAKSGYIPGQLQLVATDSDQHITLWQHVRVSGKVVDDATGQPIPKFRVVKGYASAGRPGLFWERGRVEPTRTFEGGKFALTETSDRYGYGLRIEADGYLPYESNIYHREDVEVSLDFRMKKGAAINSTLLSADGKALVGANVVVASTSSQVMITDGKVTQQTMAARATTDANGQFTLPAQIGKYAIVVVHDTAYAKLQPEEIKPQITIPAWGRVEGYTNIGLKPAVGQTMAANDYGARDADARVMIQDHAKVDATGHFVLTHVPPEKVQIGIEQITSRTAGSWSVSTLQAQRVSVVAGQTLKLQFGGTGRPVIGRLIAPPELLPQIRWPAVSGSIYTTIDPPKRAVPANIATMDREARATLSKQWQESPEGKAYTALLEKRIFLPIRVEENGTFRVEDVPAGVYTLNVSFSEQPINNLGSYKLVATASQQLTVPEMPGGRSDEPLDLGTISLSAPKSPQTRPLAK